MEAKVEISSPFQKFSWVTSNLLEPVPQKNIVKTVIVLLSVKVRVNNLGLFWPFIKAFCCFWILVVFSVGLLLGFMFCYFEQVTAILH
ncbi:hypothetical protein EMIT093MI4_40431 [Pseudomonas sp. IT-93MI4]